jgi:hypothetical protein
LWFFQAPQAAERLWAVVESVVVVM